MSNSLKEVVASTGTIPLSWVGQTAKQDYLNLGDALSPVIVSFVSGLPVKHVAAKSDEVRLAAVGTIGHMFKGGDVSFWGTGTSPHLNPNQSGSDKIPYSRPADTRMSIYATRGPFTREVLGGDAARPAVYGDPLWLLPRFHTAPTEKRYELGVILHLSELSDRSDEAVPLPDHLRYRLAQADQSKVKLISTVTGTSVSALRNRLDDILACKRIVSTSLHGMVFAESYGIPCLYFSPRASQAGPGKVDLSSRDAIDLRFVDLYRGLGFSSLDVWYQPRRQETDWQKLIKTIDRVWFPKTLDEDALIEAFPIPAAPMAKGQTGSAFDLPVIRDMPTKSAKPIARVPSLLGRLLSSFR